MSAQKAAVLLLAHGSPESPDQVPEFMKSITGGRPVPDAVIEEVRHRYTLIGKSPLTELARKQAEGLQKLLSVRVYMGIRNWKPFSADALRQMANDGEQVRAICLAPKNSSTCTGR